MKIEDATLLLGLLNIDKSSMRYRTVYYSDLYRIAGIDSKNSKKRNEIKDKLLLFKEVNIEIEHFKAGFKIHGDKVNASCILYEIIKTTRDKQKSDMYKEITSYMKIIRGTEIEPKKAIKLIKTRFLVSEIDAKGLYYDWRVKLKCCDFRK